MASRFEVTFCWEVEADISMPMRVIGRQQPRLPAIRHSWNEPGAPAEGGELEDLKVFSGARLPKPLEDRLLADESFMAAVEAEL